MISDRWIAMGIRMAIALASVMAATHIKSAGAQATVTSDSGGDPSSRSETAHTASGLAADRIGFYLRAGVNLEQLSKTRFGDSNCTSRSPAALYGCGKGPDGVSRGSSGDFGRTAGVEIGVGYVAAPELRFETILQYRPEFSFQGRANFLQTTSRQDVSADLSSLSALLVAWLDLPGFGPVRPVLGSGGGLNVVSIDETHMMFPKTTTIVPGARHVDLAVMMAAGFTASIGSAMALDLLWRYTDLGFAETGRATGRVVWRDGSRDDLELDLAETHARLSGHGLHLSLRYAF